MKKITVLTFGLLLAATPAFADIVAGNAQDGSANVNQIEEYNSTGNTFQPFDNNSAGNGGVQNVGVANSAGIINQNVNTGASSNVGSATNVAITSGLSLRGGNIDAGNPNDPSAQLASANLNQINAYNSTGNAICNSDNNSTYSAGINQVGVNGSQGVISQQVNSGVTSNVGSATAITIH